MSALLATLRRVWRPLLINLTLFVIGSAIFVELARSIWIDQAFGWDRTVSLGLYRLHSPILNWVMLAITFTGFELIVPIMLLFVFWFRRRNEIAAAGMVAVSTGGGVLISILLKEVFDRPRPDFFVPLRSESLYSFPSGHTLASVGLYGFLAIWLWQRGHKGWAAFSLLWLLLITVSRVYVGAHFASDVLASLGLGIAWLVVIAEIFRRRHLLHVQAV